MLGFTDLPYHAYQAVTWAEGIALGDIHNFKKSFGWEKVVTEFPGTTSVDCQIPWVYKESRDGLIMDDLFVYVDDRCHIGSMGVFRLEASRSWWSTCS